MLTVEQAWEVLAAVPDPEIPVISLCDLGIVRDIERSDGALKVTLTPTYSGCPATEVIEASVRQALEGAGEPDVQTATQLSPAWSTDWISAAGRQKLRDYGIAPPVAQAERAGCASQWQVVRFTPARPSCPHCGSAHTERLSEFGSTACKALYRCLACREPFDYFKPI